MQSGDEEVLRACVVERGIELATTVRGRRAIVPLSAAHEVIFEDELWGYAYADFALPAREPVPVLREIIDRGNATSLLLDLSVVSGTLTRKGEPIEYFFEAEDFTEGAPVVVGGQLAGVVVGRYGKRARVVPIGIALDRIDLEELDDEAKDAIQIADGLRTAMGRTKIHMEHFVFALGLTNQPGVRERVQVAASADIVDDASYQRRRLEEQLLSADGNVAKKKQEADNAREESAVIDREIETLKSDDSVVEKQMTGSELLAPAEKAAKKLDSSADADQLLREVHGFYDAARVFFSSSRNLGLLTLVVLIGIAIVLWLQTFRWLISFYAIGSSYLLVLRPIAKAVEYLNQARRNTTDALEQKRKSLLEEKARQKTTAEGKAFTAEQEAEKARNEKSVIERQIDRLSPVYSMAEFVRERQASGAYSRELSVVATAHRDFRRLSAFLKKIGIAEPEEHRLQSIRPIDRIVLYIDDLDRCPEAKVMEVLQATHLLLAFDLFVVIVAVDSKWLLHSIEKSGWHVPINYLEKIIQIPFVLEPMDSGGYENFIDVLTETPKRQPKPKRKLSAPAPHPTAAPSSVEFVSGGGNPQPQPQPTPPPPPEKKEPERPAIDPRPPQLLFTDDEKKFMKSLLELMTSARNTKRFVNIYRLIRATLPATRFAMLIDAQKKAYEPLQVLVAVVTNHPARAASLLAALQASAADATWSEFIAPSPLSHDLTEAGKAFAIGERPVGDFQEWIPMASRFLIRTESR